MGASRINRVPIATNQGFKNVVIEDSARAVPEYVALALTKLVPTMQAWATGGTFAEISKSKFCELQIPLPPLEVQKEIVAEIEGYQKVINGARAVLDHYRPHIPIHPDWPMVKLAALPRTIVRPRTSLTKGDSLTTESPSFHPWRRRIGESLTDGPNHLRRRHPDSGEKETFERMTLLVRRTANCVFRVKGTSGSIITAIIRLGSQFPPTAN